MFDIEISFAQKEYAWDLVNKTDFGNRGTYDGDKKKQFVGILGEVVLADMLSVARPSGKGGFDGGIDFVIHNIGFDLKTMGRSNPVKKHWTNNLVKSQYDGDKYENDGYIFASINKETSVMTVVGFIMKHEIGIGIQTGKVRVKNKGDMYYSHYHKEKRPMEYDDLEIDNKLLHSYDSFYNFYWGIDQVC